MTRFRHRLLVFLFLSASVAVGTEVRGEEDLFEWANLPDLPISPGLSGAFVGRSNGALIVAGGVSYPSSLEGGAKVWRQAIYVLEEGDSRWRTGFELANSLAYGASASTGDSLIVVGGRSAGRHYRTVYRLRWRNGQIERSALPDLPKTCAMAGAAVLGDTIYVAGGQETSTATTAMKTFWALDLSEVKPQWKALEPWPGAGRIFPVAAVQDGAFYLFGGTDLVGGEDGQVVRKPLKDAYRYRPGEGWETVAEPPRVLVAATGSAFGQSHVLVFGGRHLFRPHQPKTEPFGIRARHSRLPHHYRYVGDDRNTTP